MGKIDHYVCDLLLISERRLKLIILGVCVCVYVCVVYQVDGEEATPENIVSLLIGLGLVCSVRVQRLGLRLGFRVYGLWLRLSDLRVRV